MSLELIVLEPDSCPHCGKSGLEVQAAVYAEMTAGVAGRDTATLSYQTWVCPVCSEITVERLFYDPSVDPDNMQISTLYPLPDSLAYGLPPSVSKAYTEANRMKVVNSNAYAVMLGRMLDTVFLDRGAQGKTMYDKLNDLSQRGELPQRLADLAHNFRELRNIAAHADLGTLGPEDIPILEATVRAVLEYIYRAQALIEHSSHRLNALRERPPHGSQDNM
jgi:hypothetical protein